MVNMKVQVHSISSNALPICGKETTHIPPNIPKYYTNKGLIL